VGPAPLGHGFRLFAAIDDGGTPTLAFGETYFQARSWQCTAKNAPCEFGPVRWGGGHKKLHKRPTGSTDMVLTKKPAGRSGPPRLFARILIARNKKSPSRFNFLEYSKTYATEKP